MNHRFLALLTFALLAMAIFTLAFVLGGVAPPSSELTATLAPPSALVAVHRSDQTLLTCTERDDLNAAAVFAWERSLFASSL